jgi:hypothetical protein
MRPIIVNDLVGGTVAERARNAPTIDLPADLDRAVGLASLDVRLRGNYRSRDGKEVAFSAFVRPLSWRTTGELFLLGDGPGAAGTFRLASIASGER